MKKHLPILAKTPLFRGIRPEELPLMLDCLGAAARQYDKKETILAEGAPAEWLGIVLEGRVQIQRVDYFGNRSLLAEAGPGELFGEAFACAGVPELPVQVSAGETCIILQIPCKAISRPCGKACGFHQKLIQNLMQILAHKNLVLHQKLEVTAKRTTREKLLTYLQQQAKKAGSNIFTVPFDRQELADFLEVDRSGLSAEISKLRQEGVLESHRSRFKLL